MDLVERYCQAVRFLLPGPHQDMADELGADLRAQLEDLAEAQGRPVTEGDVRELLLRTGNPLEVAGRLLAAEPLLPPVLAVLFRFLARRVILWLVLPLSFVGVLPALFFGRPLMAAVDSGVGTFLHGSLLTLGLLVVVFAAAEALRRRAAVHGPAWDPGKLPAVRGDQGMRPRAEAAAELIFSTLFLAWWMEGGRGLLLLWRAGHLTWPQAPGAIWSAFRAFAYEPVFLLTLAGCVLALASLIRPLPLRIHRLLRGLLDGGSAWVLGAFLHLHRAELASAWEILRHLSRQRDAFVQGGAPLDALVILVLAVCACSMAFSAVGHLLKAAWSR